MGLIDQCLQIIRAAVGGFHGIGQHAVVPPVAPAGKLGDGHQFDGGDSE